MQGTFRTLLKEIFETKAKSRKLFALVCVLSVLVVGGVFWNLRQTVITMTAEPVCGQTEHSHSASCFADMLVCTQEQSEEHLHQGACYEKISVCGENEHAHTEACYPQTLAEPTLPPVNSNDDMIMPVTESTAEPTATAAPEAETTAEPTATAVPEAEPTAEPTAAPEVEPTAEPTAAPEAETTAVPTAAPEAEITAEPTATAAPEGEITAEPTATAAPDAETTSVPQAEACIAPEAGVIYAGETAVWNYAGFAEGAAYCIVYNGNIVVEGMCDMPSGSVSLPADVPGEIVLSVLSADGELILAETVQVAAYPALKTACNAFSCFAGDEIAFGVVAEGGVEPVEYRVALYQGDALLQEYEDFTESVRVTVPDTETVSEMKLEVTATDALGTTAHAQHSVPVAVRAPEDPADWAYSTGGAWAEDILRVAESQLGYCESETDFIVLADGSRQGYTRYGDWHGEPYADWEEIFVSFCLHHAGVPVSAFPAERDSADWSARLSSMGLFEFAEGYMPEKGDIAFFDADRDGCADGAGIVCAASESSVDVIRGDQDGAVLECSSSYADILGFGTLSRAYAAFNMPEDEQNPEQEEEESASEPVQLEMCVEETPEGEVILMTAVLNGVNADDYCWQWQTAPTADGEWEYVLDVLGLELTVPLTEENCSRYYRICGDGGVPLAAAQRSTFALPRDSGEESGAPAAYLVSAPQSPSARGITMPSYENFYIDIYFVSNTDKSLHAKYVADWHLPNSFYDIIKIEDIFDQICEGNMVDAPEILNGAYVGAYLATAPENTDKPANYIRRYYSTIYYGSTAEAANSNTYISEYSPKDFFDYCIFIHYEPAVPQDVTVRFYDREEYAGAGQVLGEYTFEPGMTLAQAGVTALPAAPEDPSGRGGEFLGWYYVDADGNETEFTQADLGTVVFNANTAIYPVFSKIYNVTYYDSPFGEAGGVWDQKSVAAGEYLGDPDIDEEGNFYGYFLPEPPISPEQEEAGIRVFWVYYIDGVEYVADAYDIVDSDMVLYPKFVQQYELYVHDIGPDGEEILPEFEPDEGMIEEMTLVPAGDTVADYLDYKSFDDDFLPSEVLLYTADGQLFDPDSPMPEEELHLYTYTYQLTLVRIEDADNPLVIMGREGMSLNEEDFNVGGVDYAELKWVSDGEEFKLAEVIEAGLTENLSARSDPQRQPTETVAVNFYVFLNDEFHLVQDDPVKRYTFGGNRRYLNAYDVADVYAQYGLTVDMITSENAYILPHTDLGSANLWTETLYSDNGVWYVPIVVHNGKADVYYLPNNTTSLRGLHYSNLVQENSFYTVKVEDKLNLVYEDSSDIPKDRIVVSGERVEVTVKRPTSDLADDWLVLGWEDQRVELAPVDNGDGTLTYTIDAIGQPYRFVQGLNKAKIVYDINLNPDPFDPDISTGYVPTILGKETHTEVWNVQNGSYTVLGPTNTEYHYRDGNNKYLEVKSFTAWKDAKGNNHEPGSVYALSEGETLVLNAQWRKAVGDYDMVDYYVIFDCNATSVGSTGAQWYTDSVYATALTYEGWPVTGGIKIGDGNYASTNSLNPAFHDTIELLDSEKGYTVGGVTYHVNSHPTNDYIFKRLRALQEGYIQHYEKNKQWYNNSPKKYIETNKLIVVGDTYVPINELYADNFQLLWHVFKLEGDGWHIDGHLVERKAKLTIEKTFYGDVESINRVLGRTGSEAYSITVQDSAGNVVETLTLGEATVSADGRTYTWTLDQLTRNEEYTIRENNYIADANAAYLTVAESIITNPSSQTQNANRWLKYTDSGVKVTAISYDDNETVYQTVKLMNSYLPETTMMIHKVNGVTGNGLARVQFQLKDANGDIVTLYKSDEGVYRLYQPGKEIADGIVETDAYGRIFLGWAEGYPPGDLSLTEIDPPKGYTAILPVEFSIIEAGQTVSITTTSEDAEAEDRILRIQNMPYTFNVDVQKVWLDGTDEEVEVELYRVNSSGKTRIGDPVVLNAQNNWQHRWTNQALYDGNEAAQYEVREIRIGNTYYSSTADKDGYAGYTVTMGNRGQEGMVYLDIYGDILSGPSENGEGAYRGLLVVNNKRDTGQFDFTKRGENGILLPGASFTLYGYPGDDVEVRLVETGGRVELRAGDTRLESIRTATANASGLVSFGMMPTGTYYMVETVTPQGYYRNSEIYKVVISQTDVQILKEDGTQVQSVMNERIYVDVQFKKISASTGEPLAGAVFGVYTDEECTTQVRQMISGEDGIAKTNLPSGVYWLKELQAPDGYVLNETVYRLIADEDGFEILDGDQPVEAIANELQTAQITVYKVDGAGEPLKGAVFRINKGGAPYLYDGTSAVFSPDPSFAIEGLGEGAYTIAETSAPQGYYRVTGEISFEIVLGRVTNVACPPGVTYENGVFTVCNVPGSMLPQTGGAGTARFMLAGSTLMITSLIAGLMIWIDGKRKTCTRDN